MATGTGRPIDRRDFLALAGGAALAAAASARSSGPGAAADGIPSYLAGFEDLYELDARGAGAAWFERAGLGVLVHIGVSSVLGRGERVMLEQRIPVAEYRTLADRFRPDRFDADAITDLALGAGARYVNLVARHNDGFALYDSGVSGFTSAATAAHRDLVAETALQCRRKSLGLFLTYSYARDWSHPYFYPREYDASARPGYASPDPAYKWSRDADFAHYVEYAHAQIAELLTRYGPIAGLCLDPLMGFYARPELFPIGETYRIVRRLQPQCLLAFGQGATGAEDFAEEPATCGPLADAVEARFRDPSRTAMARRASEAHRAKHNELCTPLQPLAIGYREADDGHHLDEARVWEHLTRAAGRRSSLLLGVALRPDGSIAEADVRTLREVGRRIEAEGFPGRGTGGR